MTDSTPPGEVLFESIEVIRPPLSRRARWAAIAMHAGILVISLLVLVFSFLMRVVGEQLVFMPWSDFPMPESCTSRTLFGIDCPGCGLTRAMISISSGQWQRAWSFNPASFLMFPLVVSQVPWRLIQLVRLARRKHPHFSLWLFLPVCVVMLGLVVQWILRVWS